MLLSDSSIKELIRAGVLENAIEENVGPVSYDLRTLEFYPKGGKATEVELMPGESVFVGSKEMLHLPNTLAARVMLRNSRIRQGLSLDAPLYFPGHSTRVFFRVTNVGQGAIALDCARGIAQLVFERVDGEVEHPYDGAFTDEFDYRGVG